MKRTHFLVFVLCFLHYGESAPVEAITVTLNPRRAAHVLNDHFVSLNLNPTDLLQGRPFGMGNNSTVAILKGLAPAFVRLGGADTGKYQFKTKTSQTDGSSGEIIITEEHWKGLNDFLRKSGLDVIACLNYAHSADNSNKWDPRNALEIITFSDRQQYNITWQLGYEPIRTENVSGTQFGKDITQLRSILNAFPRYRAAKIVGPDIRALHKKQDVDHVLDTLIESGPAINAVTWHPRWPHASAITQSDASEDGYDFPPDYLEWDRSQLHKFLQRTLLKKPFWISEPKAENTGSFAEGLIYARRLALAAKLGIEVVMKQPSMQDISHPKPEYWVALLHKKTMGRTLLDSRSMTNHSEVHLVIQCTNKNYDDEQDGGITILAVNTAGSAQRAIIRGLPLGHIGETVHQFVLTGGNEHENIFTQMAYLNGEPLLMTDDGQLPEIIPKSKRLGPNLQVKLPPYSLGFWIVPHAKVKICQQEPETLIPFNLDEITPALMKTTQQSVNSLNNINNILIDTLLNPLAEKDEEEATEAQQEHKRSIREISIESLGAELKRNMDEIKNIMQEHRSSNWRDAVHSESSENHLRGAEQKIDSLVNDLDTAINGADQKAEFELFLEKAGLKTDFGQLMMNEKRQKRETDSNMLKHKLFFKEGNMDLADIEKTFRRILAKYKRTMDPKRAPSLEFGKISREMHEDLLLKEITLLEKTEETLADVMKNRQERFEQLEELIHNELEQIKDEKLAALVEIKAASVGEEKGIAKTKRDVVENPIIESLKKNDPLAVIKNFISKRKEELTKRRALHEQQALEARNKLKGGETTEASQTTATPTEASELHDVITEELKKDEKRRSEVLKHMAQSIKLAESSPENSESLEDDIFTKRKPRKTAHDEADRQTVNLPSVLIEKILDSLKNKQPVDRSTFPTTTDATTTQQTTKSANQEILESAITTATESVSILSDPGPQPSDASSGEEQTSKTMESTTVETAQPESTTETAQEERVRRDTVTIHGSAETPDETNNRITAGGEKMLGNLVIKKKPAAQSLTTSEQKKDEEVLKVGSTVKNVIDDFLPKAYDTAKNQIENLGFAEYLQNLGSMVEQLKHINVILQDGAIFSQNTSDHHIQKIKRNRRETEETTTETEETTTETEETTTKTEETTTETETASTTEPPTFAEIAEMMATDDVIEKALDTLAANLVSQQAEDNEYKPETSDEDPISPRLGKERGIIKEIINTLMDKPEPKRNPRHSFPAPTNLDEPVPECLQKLRPGVYVVPSKDMANVHAEQTAKSAVARKDGKPTANVLTLNIYYDKTEKPEVKQNLPAQLFGHQWSLPQIYQPLQEPVRQYPTRYSMLPFNQQYPNLRPPTKYNQISQQPYNDYSYEKEPLPKYIPLTTWKQAESGDQTWQLANLPMEKTGLNDWLSEKPSQTFSPKDPVLEEPAEITYDRRRSIEPYWNKTIRAIFEETADDPFWKFLKVPEQKTNDLKEPEKNEQPRKKRSLDYSTSILYDRTPYINTPDDYYLNNNQIDYRRDRRSMLDNNIVKQKQSGKYPLDNNLVMHGLLGKQLKKLTDFDSSLEPGLEIQTINFQQPQPPQFVYPAMPEMKTVVAVGQDKGDKSDQSISFPLRQVYDIAVDFVKRLSSAA